MQNTWSRSFLVVIFLSLNRFSKFLWHFLRVLECKRIIRSRFAIYVSEQGDLEKSSVCGLIAVFARCEALINGLVTQQLILYLTNKNRNKSKKYFNNMLVFVFLRFLETSFTPSFNTHIEYTLIFTAVKNDNYQMKTFDSFLNSAKKIDEALLHCLFCWMHAIRARWTTMEIS